MGRKQPFKRHRFLAMVIRCAVRMLIESGHASLKRLLGDWTGRLRQENPTFPARQVGNTAPFGAPSVWGTEIVLRIKQASDEGENPCWATCAALMFGRANCLTSAPMGQFRLI